MRASLAVVILTYNEEVNLPTALESICGWADQVFVVDSYSTDRTLEIARQFEVSVYQNPWQDWAAQRNWALAKLPIHTEWVFFLDADEVATHQFRRELDAYIANADSSVAALQIRQRFVFLGRELRHAHESPPLVRMIRPGRAKWQCLGAREYTSVDGEILAVSTLLHHEDRRGLTFWIEKQNKNASREAEVLLKGSGLDVDPKFGQERAVRYWLQQSVWRKLPLFIRPFIYFFYVYCIRLGFLDGWQGFVFCFLHGLWYRMLIDAKYAEARLTLSRDYP